MSSAEPTVTRADDFHAVGERINALIDASASGGVVARERAEELVRLVADLYGAGLERLLTILHELGHLDDEALAALAADDLVAGLLLVHDCIPMTSRPGSNRPWTTYAPTSAPTAAMSSCWGSRTTWSGSDCSAAATAARRPRSR